jgi:branched-chain amino acid aminotransferase
LAPERFSHRKIWLDGRLVPWPEATVHVLGQSIQRGSLVFDVMACYEVAGRPRVLGLREHSERFLRSAELNGMDLPLDLDGVLEAIGETVRANPGADLIKISAYYPGLSLDVLPSDPHPSVAVAAVAFADVLPPGTTVAPRPARLQIAEPTKTPPKVLSPRLKVAAGYTAAAVAKARARREGFDEILFLDETGNVAEASTMSFLVVQAGTIHAPPLEYVLDGITRRAVLEMAEEESIPVRVAPISRDLLEQAEEAFLVGTSVNVWPVERIDERKLPAPIPGPVAQRLISRFERVLEGNDPLSPRWLQPV